ncbi:MAG: AbgT family transporter [Ignavibacteriae bacterium]|nr:AbgT family transporter [Ignavibacteriota bacterium]
MIRKGSLNRLRALLSAGKSRGIEGPEFHLDGAAGKGHAVASHGGARKGSRVLDRFERVGNRVPDPVVLFVVALVATWIISALLAGRDFGLTDPRTSAPLRINDLLTLPSFAVFFSGMTQAFVSFPPLGLVLVMVIGVGVAEKSGLVGAILRGVLAIASPRVLTPLVAIASICAHLLADSAIVILLPLAGALFYVSGRHPLAGIIAAFGPLAGVIFANFFPSGLDALLAGFSEGGARIVDPAYQVGPLSNYWLAIATSVVVVPLTWWLVERVVEPRLRGVVVDGDPALMPTAPEVTAQERRGLWAALATALVFAAAMVITVAPASSPFRAPDGSLSGAGSPLMMGLIPLLLVGTLLPSIAFGVSARTFRGHREVIDGMVTTMSSMGAYIVMVFFAALFTKAFADSNLGALIALKGAGFLRALGMPPAVMIIGVVLLTASLDMLVPSASAKWALLAPILVPMLMSVGIAPELTQAAFRLGDGPVNVLTPLMAHFPLVLAFCRRYVTKVGVGTLMSLLLPLGIMYLLVEIVLLLCWWGLGLPLGIGSRYTYP